MLTKYIQAALDKANFEILEDEEPYYGEISDLPGVWATGKTLEACRRNVSEALEDWLLLSIAKHLPIPRLGKINFVIPEETVIHD